MTHWMHKVFGKPWDSRPTYRVGATTAPFALALKGQIFHLTYNRDTVLTLARNGDALSTSILKLQNAVHSKLDANLKLSFDVAELESAYGSAVR